MFIAGKLLIGVLIAVIATLSARMLGGGQIDITLLGALFLLSNTAVVLLTHRPLLMPPEREQREPAAPEGRPGAQQRRRSSPPRATSGPRREGQVKWFNSAKGFGFITVDNGDEVFVHFRSIRGEGRRSLGDGQRVSFVVASTEKGPQAEDVQPLGAS